MALSNTVAVIGANGYIGSHLVSHLEAAGHHVFAIDRHPGSEFGAENYLTTDITNRVDLENLPEADYIFLFTGLTGTHAGFDEYEKYLSVNETGLLHLLDHLRSKQHKPRVVFPSTRLVYRGKPQPLDEESKKEAKTVYAANKLAAEYFLQAYANAFEIPYTILRICVPYANLFGSQYSYGTIGFFLKMAGERGEISIYGDGSLQRTFTHIEDLCRQITTAAFHKQSINQTYNTAGETLSLLGAADLIARRFHAKIKHVEWPEQDLRIESGDTAFDYSKLSGIMAEPMIHRIEDWINGLKTQQ